MEKTKVCVLVCGLPRCLDLVINNINTLFHDIKYEVHFTICSSIEQNSETEYVNYNIYDLIKQDKLSFIQNILLLESDKNTEYRNSVNYCKKISMGIHLLSPGYDYYIVIRSDCILNNIDFLDDIDSESEKLYFSSNHLNPYTKDVSEKVNEDIIVTRNFKSLRYLRDLYTEATHSYCGGNNYAGIVTYNLIKMYDISYDFLDIQYKLVLSKCNIIAISGDSGSGKTTLMKHLMGLFPESKLINLETDRYHKWERGNENYQTITHLNPDANHLELMSNDVYNLKIGNDIYQVDYDHTTGKFTNKQLIESKDNIILCGLHTLYNQKMNDIIDIKVFMDTDRELIKKWKIRRDVDERGHSMERVIQQINSRKEDYYKYIDSQKENADIVIQFYEETGKGVKCAIFIKNTKIINKIVSKLLHHYDIRPLENGNIFFELNGQSSSCEREENFDMRYFKELVSIFTVIVYDRVM